MALTLKDKMSVKEIMTAISSMVIVAGNLAHKLVEMCELQCEDCDYSKHLYLCFALPVVFAENKTSSIIKAVVGEHGGLNFS